jgi:formylglycine-generating enzyme required for sulfatase activity
MSNHRNFTFFAITLLAFAASAAAQDAAPGVPAAVPGVPAAAPEATQPSAQQNDAQQQPAPGQKKRRRMVKAPQDMALIPAGEFIMGSPEGEGIEDERPQHKVYLDAFFMDKYDVTVAQYAKFSKATKTRMFDQPAGSEDNAPVVEVDWDEAFAYCKWAGKRLPTEAEWEKAARGGAGGKWSFGSDENQLRDYAWYANNSGSQLHPVGQKKPNQYGLYDMAGNVDQLVQDWYYDEYYKETPDANPPGPIPAAKRVLRGGAQRNCAVRPLRFSELPLRKKRAGKETRRRNQKTGCRGRGRERHRNNAGRPARKTAAGAKLRKYGFVKPILFV